MARTVRNAKLTTRSARARLPARREPYWTVIDGSAIGYRRGANGGTWIAKFRPKGQTKRYYEALGAADDARDPDGISVFSFAQAQVEANNFFVRKAREIAGDLAPSDGPYTVASAVADYLKAFERRGGKSTYTTRRATEAHVLPALGALPVPRLTARKIEGWHQSLAEGPARTRTVAGANQKYRKHDTSPEGVRKRRATANRLLTVLKAALNHAFKTGHVVSDDAWRRVSPFKAVDSARIRYLDADEITRFVNTCQGAFRNLVQGALLTGCRYSELTNFQVGDFNADAGIMTARTPKGGHARHVVLTDEGQRFFEKLTAGKLATDLIFNRDDGGKWGASHQLRPMREASARAKIKPVVSFHILRHTHASALAMRGAPMGVIAKQLGHSDTRMTEKHYAHLAPSYVAETVRKHFPNLGFSKSVVTPLRRRAR